ncbi:MAG: ABC transporter permease [Acidobacteriota bacterium]
MIRRSPLASLVIVLTFGFGIGANGVFFASFYGSAIRPLPFDEPDRLVGIHQTQTRGDETLRGVAGSDFAEWRGSFDAFSAMGAHAWENFGFQTDDGTYRVEGARVTASLFPLLGVEPQLGRNFTPAESRPGGSKVTLLSHRLWIDHFGGDASVLGRSVLLSGERYEVVGVMPEGFRFSHYGLVWTPLQDDLVGQPRDGRPLGVIARLRPGAQLAEARTQMAAESARLAERFPAICVRASASCAPGRRRAITPRGRPSRG